MGHIHMVLQGKGGVGKSFIMALVAQYKKSKGQQLLCIDTDPVNGTLSGYRRLDVVKLDIMEDDEISPIKFDMLIDLLTKNDGNDAIVDNGAASFVAFSSYLLSNEVPALLDDMGHKLVVHTVITGGQAQDDTLNGFSDLVEQFPSSVVFIVWLNPFWGPIKRNGKQFEEFRVYQDNKDRIAAIITLPAFKHDTFARNLSDMLQERLTFDEAIELPSMPIMVRQRLTIMKKQLYELMDGVQVIAMNKD